MTILFWVLLVLLVLYVLVILFVSWISVHPIRTPIFLSPGAMGTPQEDVEFKSLDGTPLRAWWVEGHHQPEGDREPARVAILLHGYLMTRSELVPVAVRLWQEGFTCLLPDFRAHGGSGGNVCGVGWLERQDVLAAVGFARERIPDCRIVLIGSSMGAAASAFAAAEDPSIHALVLDCAYSRLPSAALGWWRFVGGNVLAFLLSPTVLMAAPWVGVNPFKVDVADALRRAKRPTLLIHGERDKLALPVEAERNLAACGDLGRLIWMPNSNHAEGRWLHPDLYHGALLAFLREHDFLEN